jgi:hypothetical protein
MRRHRDLLREPRGNFDPLSMISFSTLNLLRAPDKLTRPMHLVCLSGGPARLSGATVASSGCSCGSATCPDAAAAQLGKHSQGYVQLSLLGVYLLLPWSLAEAVTKVSLLDNWIGLVVP